MSVRRAVLRVALAATCWAAWGGVAHADTVAPEQYRARLRDARALVAAGALEPAREVLRRTTAVRVEGATVTVDDSALAERLGASAHEADLADLDRRLATIERVISPAHDAARAEAALRELGGPAGGGVAVSFGQLLFVLLSRFYDLLGRPDPALLIPAQIAIGVGLAVSLGAILVRGVRERLRVEVVLPERRAQAGRDPVAHRDAAEEAERRGDLRAAVHGWYRYALAALAAREALAYDPSLTDRELLVRAAAVPRADALRDLVALHERVWFGLHPADAPDASRAGALARAVAP